MQRSLFVKLFKRQALTLLASTLLTANCLASALSAVVDDFRHDGQNSLGIQRQFINDTVAGGKTVSNQQVVDGVLEVKGSIMPPRGQPGWASSVLLLEATGGPQDASDYEGIRLRIKVNKGNVSLSANSTDIDNFDYHAAPITVPPNGQFHDVMIPFNSMKRAWSQQVPLNTRTLSSLSIVAYDVKPGAFDFAVDEVSFYSAEDNAE